NGKHGTFLTFPYWLNGIANPDWIEQDATGCPCLDNTPRAPLSDNAQTERVRELTYVRRGASPLDAPVELPRAFVPTGSEGPMKINHVLRRQNLLLAVLPPGDLALLKPHLRDVKLDQGAVLQEQDETIKDVYFPYDSIVSLLAVMQQGDAIETATVGREGAVGS